MDPYFAGYVDGEGSLGVCGSSIRVYISNTYRPMLEVFQREFGGRLASKKSGDRGRPAWEWAVYGDRAEIVCRRLLPFLREKLTQAALCVEYHNTPRGSYRRQEIKAELSRLKRPVFGDDGTVTFAPIVQ